MKEKTKKILSACVFTIVSLIACASAFAANIYGATDDPIEVVNNLSDFLFGLVRAVGMIMLGFSVLQIGLSFKSHDPSQRANGFLSLAGGLLITFAREILQLITG